MALAQSIPSSEEAGRAEERFAQPIAPRSQAAAPRFLLRSTEAPAQAKQMRLMVREITVEGSSIYTRADLSALTGMAIGSVSLQEIYDLAAKLTAKYSDDGYALSRVIVPPQSLDPEGASIRLQAIEGYIDQVKWPAGTEQYRDLFSSYEAKITAERPIRIKTIERYLLLAGDLPGLDFKSTLEPSEKRAGAATLVVDMSEKRFDASATVDNRGTEGRGPYQYTLSGTANNVLKQHEALQVTYAGAFQTEELQYVSGNFRQVLNSEGLTFNFSGSYNTGEPGTEHLQAIQFETKSIAFQAGLSFPVIRTRERNLTVSALAFAKTALSNGLGDRINEDRFRGFRVGVNFDWYDKFKGVTQFTGTFSQGIEGLGSTKNDNAKASRATGRVDFTKIEGGIARYQSLPKGFSVVAKATGQHAFTPLLSSEECTYGGGSYGRAFDPAVLGGDHCVKLSAELRFDPQIEGNPFSQTQLYSFIDYGSVWRRKPASGVSKQNKASSAGAGIRLGIKDKIAANLEASRRLNGTVGENDWQGYFSISAKY